jgi:DNA-binding GntR family transcriptional regulator
MVIYSASRNGRLSYLANQNMDRMHSFLVMSLDSPRRPEMVLIEHQRIIEALAERSPDLSSKWALSHMGSLEDSLIRLLDKEVHEQEE